MHTVVWVRKGAYPIRKEHLQGHVARGLEAGCRRWNLSGACEILNLEAGHHPYETEGCAGSYKSGLSTAPSRQETGTSGGHCDFMDM